MANAMVPIGKITLTSTQNTISLANLPQNFRDLRLVINATSSAAYSPGLLINGDTSNSSYIWVQMMGDGSGNGSNNGSGISNSFQILPNWNMSSSQPQNIVMDFFEYSQTDKHKVLLERAGTASTAVNVISARWISTAAITKLDIVMNSGGTFAVGSTFELFGVIA
jgi:hypothetical protein